jgi:hypothetical protein
MDSQARSMDSKVTDAVDGVLLRLWPDIWSCVLIHLNLRTFRSLDKVEVEDGCCLLWILVEMTDRIQLNLAPLGYTTLCATIEVVLRLHVSIARYTARAVDFPDADTVYLDTMRHSCFVLRCVFSASLSGKELNSLLALALDRNLFYALAHVPSAAFTDEALARTPMRRTSAKDDHRALFDNLVLCRLWLYSHHVKIIKATQAEDIPDTKASMFVERWKGPYQDALASLSSAPCHNSKVQSPSGVSVASLC